MKDLQEKVRKFMTAAEQDIRNLPGLPPEKVIELGLKLITEELHELHQAIFDAQVMQGPQWTDEQRRAKLADVADAIGDLLYVVTWNGLAWGFNMPAIMEEIQRANLAKFGPGSWKDENGKQRKPPGWTPPDIEQFMDAPVEPVTK